MMRVAGRRWAQTHLRPEDVITIILYARIGREGPTIWGAYNIVNDQDLGVYLSLSLSLRVIFFISFLLFSFSIFVFIFIYLRIYRRPADTSTLYFKRLPIHIYIIIIHFQNITPIIHTLPIIYKYRCDVYSICMYVYIALYITYTRISIENNIA